MNSTELRIGNIIDTINRKHEVHLPNGYPRLVGRIDLFEVDLFEVGKSLATQSETINVPIKDCCGVPITDELLKCLYFKYDEPNYIIKLDLGIEICYHEHKKRFSLFFRGHHHDLKISYIHEIQNLHYSLTGKELKKQGVLNCRLHGVS